MTNIHARYGEVVADRIEAELGPLVGSPEYLADPVKRARAEKRRREAAEKWAQIAIDALLPALGEWQDISTAPKDGSRFLAWCPEVGRVIMKIDGVHRHTWAIDPSGRFGCYPTHWCPLPTPPETGL